MDRAVLILSALLLNALLAGPRAWYLATGLSRISRYPATLIRDFDRRLNRQNRSKGDREVRGLVLVAAAILLSILVGVIAQWVFKHDLGFVELLIVTVALPVRPSWDIASHIAKSLRTGDLAAARKTLDGTAWRHHALLDEHGLARAAIETLAVNFSEKILAPALWYIMFGLPGLLVSKSVYLLHETLSQPGEQPFAKAANAAHFILHYIPSRVASVLWLAASLFLSSSTFTVAAKNIATGLGHYAPQLLSLWSAASVLTLSLGGPASIYSGEAWAGTGTPKALPSDIKKAQYLFALLCLFLFIFLGLFL